MTNSELITVLVYSLMYGFFLISGLLGLKWLRARKEEMDAKAKPMYEKFFIIGLTGASILFLLYVVPACLKLLKIDL